MVAGINIYVIQIEHTIKWSATIIVWFDPFSVLAIQTMGFPWAPQKYILHEN